MLGVALAEHVEVDAVQHLDAVVARRSAPSAPVGSHRSRAASAPGRDLGADLHLARRTQQHEVARVAAPLLVAPACVEQRRRSAARRRTRGSPCRVEQLVHLLAHRRVEAGVALGQPQRDQQPESRPPRRAGSARSRSPTRARARTVWPRLSDAAHAVVALVAATTSSFVRTQPYDDARRRMSMSLERGPRAAAAPHLLPQRPAGDQARLQRPPRSRPASSCLGQRRERQRGR